MMTNNIHSSVLLYSGSNFNSLQTIFNKLDSINNMITQNIKTFSSEYLIEEKDIKLFKETLYYFNSTIHPRSIEVICEKKPIINKTSLKEETKISIAKILIMLSACSFNLYKEFRKSYSELILLQYKYLKKLLLEDILDISQVVHIVKFRLLTSLFEKDIFAEQDKYEIKDNFFIRKNQICTNQFSLWSTIKFLSSFGHELELNKDQKAKIETILIKSLSFLDQTILSNYRNITLLNENSKCLRLLETCWISDKIAITVNAILIKIYQYRLNLKWVFSTMSNIFFNPEGNLSDCNNNKSKMHQKGNCYYLNSQILFLKELFECERAIEENGDIIIPNGFYFIPSRLSGLITSQIKQFPKEGYSMVVSFNFRLNKDDLLKENLHKKIFTIFSITQTKKNSYMNLFIENFKLKLEFHKYCLEIDNINPNCNYRLWLFQTERGRLTSRTKLYVYLNDKNLEYEGTFPYLQGSYIVSIGAKKKIETDEFYDCFNGIIGTFILFNRIFKKSQDILKVQYLLQLKGSYENIIYSNLKRNEIFSQNIEKILEFFAMDEIDKKIDLIISTRSICGVKNFKDFKKEQYAFKTHYYDRYPEFNINKPKFYSYLPMDISSSPIYPIKFTNTYDFFIKNKGIMYLQLHIYYYLNIHSESLSHEQYNTNLKNLLELFFYSIELCILKDHYKEIDNFLRSLHYLIDQYSSKGVYFNESFLTPFSKYAMFLLQNKLLFNNCSFLMRYEYYDKNCSSGIHVLFEEAEKIITNFKTIEGGVLSLDFKQHFIRMLEFDKIYLTKSNNKECRKSFSHLMETFIETIITAENTECIIEYLNELEKYKPIEDDETINSIKSLSLIGKYEGDYISQKKEDFIIIYHLLKNLYIGIKNDKNMRKFFELIEKEKRIEFFSDLCSSVIKYQEILFLDDLAIFIPNYTVNKEVIKAEYIKSICILFFFDLIFYEETYIEPIVQEDSFFNTIWRKNKNNNADKIKGRCSQVNFSKEFSNNKKMSEPDKSFPKSVFKNFTTTPYSFLSVFFFPFRKITSREKILCIKQGLNLKELPHLEIDQSPSFEISLRVVVELIRYISECDNNTCFGDKFILLEFSNEIFFKFLIQVINKYQQDNNSNNNSNIVDEIAVENVFGKNRAANQLYYLLLEMTEFKEIDLGNEIVEGGKIIANPNKIHLPFFNKVKMNLFELIDKTFVVIKDPFYFNLLTNLSQKICYINFILECIEHIILQYDNAMEMNSDVAYLNQKNLIVLIYKITIKSQINKLFISNIIYQKSVILFLMTFCNSNSKLLLLKVPFCLSEEEENIIVHKISSNENINSFKFLSKAPNKKTKKYKLITELLFKILFSLILKTTALNLTEHIDLNMLEGLIKDLFTNNDHSICGGKKSSLYQKSFIYLIDFFSIWEGKDKFPIINELDTLTCKFDKFNQFNKDNSVLVIFIAHLVKAAINIENIQGKSGLYKFFLKIARQLLNEAQSLIKKYKQFSKNSYNKEIHKKIHKFIEKGFNDKNADIDDELKKLFDFNDNEDKEENALIILRNQRKRFSGKKIQRIPSDMNKFGRISLNTSTESYKTMNYAKSQLNISNFDSLRNKRRTKHIKFDFKIPKSFTFKHDFLLKQFSLFFIEFLTKDKEFIKIKNIYKNKYSYDLKNIDQYSIDYPTKLDNFTIKNYSKLFLANDFKFENTKYINFSHSFLKRKGKDYKCKYKIKFPKIPQTFLYDISKVIKDEKKIVYKTELITLKGTIFGELCCFKNCLYFKATKGVDERHKCDNQDSWYSSLVQDFRDMDKEIVLQYEDISEIIIKRYLYMLNGIEIFLKNGKSYFFNLFQKEQAKKILDYLSIFPSLKKLIIKDLKTSFEISKYKEQWANRKITTFDYILLLNKYAGRSYNDINQYPIFPWIEVADMSIRDFKFPISLQKKDTQVKYKKSTRIKNRFHGNHYSNSAYVLFYLMRLNPFTNGMLDFQTDKFDEPDRQFLYIKTTLDICEKYKDNRELIPEIYSLPECYVNFNCNDFGKQDSYPHERVHNVHFEPFGENPIDFTYRIRYELNTNPEVNQNIHEWFDFVFGVNQLKKNDEDKYTRFRNESYEELMDFEKMKTKCKSIQEMYSMVQDYKDTVINLGQTPMQLLSVNHPQMIKEMFPNREGMQVFNEEMQLQPQKDEQYIYFTKSFNKKNFYCLIKHEKEGQREMLIEMYDNPFTGKKLRNKLNHCLLLTKTKEQKKLIYRPKYIFCELRETEFLICRYLENTIQIKNSIPEVSFLLDDFITTIIRVSESKFLTGSQSGIVSLWEIKRNSDEIIALTENERIFSNEGSVSCLHYEERMNIFISCDNNTAVIRNFFTFELMTYIKIKNTGKRQSKLIVDVKISPYDLVYIMYNEGYSEDFVIAGYTVNGINFGEIKGHIVNFEFTKHGKILCGYIDCNVIKVIHPVSFECVKEIKMDCGNEGFFHFDFEPVLLYFTLGYIENKQSYIKRYTPKDEEEVKLLLN